MAGDGEGERASPVGARRQEDGALVLRVTLCTERLSLNAYVYASVLVAGFSLLLVHSSLSAPTHHHYHYHYCIIKALPWALACIFGISCFISTCIPPVSHRILGIPLCPCIDLYLAILQQIHCTPLFSTVSSCIRTYLLGVSRCIPLYLSTVSHRLKNGIWPKIHSRGEGL